MTRPVALRTRLAAAAASVALLGLGGCVAVPYGTPVPVGAPTFDRAFDAALGAMADQGLGISTQNRSAGVIVGQRGGQTVTATVRTQADGTTQVAFDQTGPAGQDPNLVQRVVGDYHRRMGR